MCQVRVDMLVDVSGARRSSHVPPVRRSYFCNMCFLDMLFEIFYRCVQDDCADALLYPGRYLHCEPYVLPETYTYIYIYIYTYTYYVYKLYIYIYIYIYYVCINYIYI